MRVLYIFANYFKENKMYDTLKPVLEKELADIKEAGLYKRERIIAELRGPRNGGTVLALS